MLGYILKKFLCFVPMLLLVSLLGFVLVTYTPGDPVERFLNINYNDENSITKTLQSEERKWWREKLGLNLPTFYLSLQTIGDCDTLYKIINEHERSALDRLCYQYGDWEMVSAYRSALYNLEQKYHQLSHMNENDKEAYENDRVSIANLKTLYDDRTIKTNLFYLEKSIKNAVIGFSLKQVISSYNLLKTAPTKWKRYVPNICFHADNRYHRWLFGDGSWLTGKGAVYSKGIIRGDLGISYRTKQPVSQDLYPRIGWSLFFVFTSVLLAYILGILCGMYIVKGNYGKSIETGLVLIYSLPNFFVAILLLMLFANPDVLMWFPASGIMPIGGDTEHVSFFQRILHLLPYLILPLIAYTYSSFAFLAQLTGAKMKEVMKMQYIVTARAKGLSEWQILYKHALKNAIFPVITVFANVFPAAMGGSVILETIFSISGMGSEIYTAVSCQDYPIIIAVFTCTGIFTVIGFLVSDILYALCDPRIAR